MFKCYINDLTLFAPSDKYKIQYLSSCNRRGKAAPWRKQRFAYWRLWGCKEEERSKGYRDGGVDVGELTDRGRGIEARSYNMAWRRQKRLGLTTGGRTVEQRADMQKRRGRGRAATEETVLEDDGV